MGGLIVIDFIDMLSLKNKRAIEDKLWTSLSIDRAKVQVGRISRFGLMEMSRQRLRPSLQERWTQDVASLSTAVLRLIEEEAGKKRSGEVRAVVSPDMSIFLLNERRPRVNEIEERTGVRIVIVSDPTRSDNRFEVSRLRDDDKKLKDSASYKIQDEIGSSSSEATNPQRKTKQETPAVNIKPPKKPRRKKEGFLKKFINSLTKKEKEEPKTKPSPSRNTRRNNQNKPRQGAPRKNTSNQARRNPNAKPRAPEVNKPNNKKTDPSNKKPANNRSDSKDRNQSDKRNNQKESDSEKRVNQTERNGNTNEKPKSTKPKPRPRRVPPKENIEKNGNVIPEEKIITEVDGNVVTGKPVRSTRIKESSSDKETKRKNQKSSTVSEDEKKSDIAETPLKEKAVKEPKQEKTPDEKPVKEPKLEKTPDEKPVKEPKQEESIAKEEPVVKAKDRGRASNDPRNK
jgi:ribonuclease E